MVTDFRFGITLNTNETLDVSYILDVLRSLDAMLKDIERNLTDKRRVKASVEGVLEMVSHKGETIIAGVREHRTRNYVRCLLTVEQWRDDLRQRNLWDRRVLVYGAVAYDHEGIPLSIRDVTEIVERDTGLNIRDFQGAAPGILGNHEVDEFISRLRGNQA